VVSPSQPATVVTPARVISTEGPGEERPRVLLLSTWHPEPADNGRKQRTRQMIAALAETCAVFLVSLLPDTTDAVERLPPVPGVRQQWTLPLPAFAPRSRAALAALFQPMPRSLAATWNPATAAALATIARRERVTVALGTDLRTLRYLLALGPDIHTILDEPDVSPFVADWQKYGNQVARLRAHGRQVKYQRFLRDAAARLDVAVAASAREAAAWRLLSGSTRIALLENAVALPPGPAWTPQGAATLLYTGSLTYGANAEAVGYFADQILPRLATVMPEVRLQVTGERPAILPPAASDGRIDVLGRLDQAVLETVYHQARACVVPLLSGTGTRIKILEALARGVPVVSTSKGAEGLALIAGEHLLLADTPADFAAATLRLLQDDALALRLGQQGRALVCQRYSWTARSEELCALVQALVRRRGKTW
jgi:polysaccharide biosynthesis protein PslH